MGSEWSLGEVDGVHERMECGRSRSRSADESWIGEEEALVTCSAAGDHIDP